MTEGTKKNVIKVGAGNDTIYGYNPTDTVSLTSGSVTGTYISGNDFILNTSNGSVRFVGTRAVRVGSVIYGNLGSGTSGNDTITNFNNNVTINALAGNDSIQNGGANVSINAGEGSNTVKNYASNAPSKSARATITSTTTTPPKLSATLQTTKFIPTAQVSRSTRARVMIVCPTVPNIHDSRRRRRRYRL